MIVAGNVEADQDVEDEYDDHLNDEDADDADMMNDEDDSSDDL